MAKVVIFNVAALVFYQWVGNNGFSQLQQHILKN